MLTIMFLYLYNNIIIYKIYLFNKIKIKILIINKNKNKISF
jgi:hypothetical protein